ncbi:MAG TPA: hypothetical protein VF857_07340, partial [Spirochaetota bacterium]
QSINDFINGKSFDSTILHRYYVHELTNSKSDRFLCEELINIRNDKDIERYGEYRIPFNGNISVLQARIYYRDGKSISSNKVTEVNANSYISFDGVTKDCLIHISYEIDGYRSVLGKSDLIESGTIFVNDYDEEVSDVEVVIAHPSSLKMKIHHSQNLLEENEKQNDMLICRLRSKILQSVEHEANAPDDRDLLSWYSLSSILNYNDLVSWFNGVNLGKMATVKEYHVPNKSRMEKIRRTYSEVNKIIVQKDRREENVRYIDDVLFFGSGTVTEKTLIAKALLLKNGIQSYLSLVANRSDNVAPQEITFEKYESALLYIPGMGEETDMWLDFSDPHLPCGSIRSDLEKGDAIVITDDGAFTRKAYSQILAAETTDLRISAERDKTIFELSTSFAGESATIGKYFSDDINKMKYALAVIDQYFTDSDLTRIETKQSEDGTFHLSISGEMRNIIVESPQSVFISPFLKGNKLLNYSTDISRQSSLVIREGDIVSEKYTYVLPDSVSHEEMLFSKSMSFEGITVSYALNKKSGSRELTVNRKMVISPVAIDVSKYGEFLKFVSDCNKIDAMKVTLKKSVKKE